MRARLLIPCLVLFACAGPAGVLAQTRQGAGPEPVVAVGAEAFGPVQRAAVLDVLARRLDHYVMADRRGAIRAALARERPALIATAGIEPFREAVNAVLLEASNDRHLAIMVEAPPAAGAAEAAGPAFGLHPARTLAGGVAYWRVDGFSGEAGAPEAIDRAMAAMRGAPALILDLRWNGGGNDAAYRRMMGHLAPAPMVLMEIHTRRCAPDPADAEGCVQDGSRDTTVMTADAVAEPAFATRPIVVLTSDRTFSAGEATAFVLRAHGRATIVGETTGGGGHVSASMDLGPRFSVVMPIGVGTHPLAQGGWEGTGVVPDLAVAEDEALEVALARLATDRAASGQRAGLSAR